MKQNGLIASDLDGTLIPTCDDPGALRDAFSFGALVRKRAGIALAYVTGRHLELALCGIEESGLPLPDTLVCDVGTSIYTRRAADWDLDQEYRRWLRAAWDGHTAEEVARVLGELRGARDQEAERQREFKHSYYVGCPSDLPGLESRIHERLRRAGIEARVVTSADPAHGVGLLDLLPPLAAKDSALEHVWRASGLPRDRVVFAGDSGNDVHALTAGFNAIVVGNAAPDVRAEVRRRAARKGLEQRVYFASACHAAGVLEGCRHFGLLPPLAESAS